MPKTSRNTACEEDRPCSGDGGPAPRRPSLSPTAVAAVASGGLISLPFQAYLEERRHVCPPQGLLQTEGEKHLGLSVSEKVVLLIWKREQPTVPTVHGARDAQCHLLQAAPRQVRVIHGSQLPVTPGNKSLTCCICQLLFS